MSNGFYIWFTKCQLKKFASAFHTHTALPPAMRYILKAESDDSRGVRRKLYCIIAGSAVINVESL
jgi:hypothetical protein